MIRRPLGCTDMTITTVGFGAWAIGGWMWGPQDDADSIAAIRAALDAGVNWIDTAPIYGSGRSERVVGEALKGMTNQQRPLVFTKFGLGDDSAKRRQSATRAEIVGECEASLKRLGIGRIDLYQIHWPVPQPVAEIAGACETLLKAGKIRAIGVCNYSVEQLAEWTATGLPLHTLQCPYSLLRPAVSDAQLPWCHEHGLGALAYSSLFRGMLFGTWTPAKTFAADDTRGQHKDYTGARLARHLLAVDELKAVAAADELTCAQLCIGALLCTPGLSGCIVGARTAAQGTALGELGMPITAKQMAAVDAIIGSLVKDLETIPATV